MAAKDLGPKQSHKKGNEHFPEEVVVPKQGQTGGRDVSDEEAGIDKILRRDENSKPVTDDGHDADRDREWITAPET